jgi:transposase
MDERLSKIQKLAALLEAAMTRIAERKAKGRQDSGNSSKPLHSNMGRKHKPLVEPSGPKCGGQPGHPQGRGTRCPWAPTVKVAAVS